MRSTSETVSCEKMVVGHQSISDIMQDCADLLGQLEEMFQRLDPQAQPITEHVLVSLREIMERAGAERLENETSFSVARHQAVPAKRVATGVPVLETISPGYLFDGRIIKRARVRIEG